MRILHIGKYFPPFAGGIESYMATLLPALETQDIQTAAIVHDHQKPSSLWPAFQADKDYPSIYRAPSYGRLLYAPISPHFPYWLQRSLKAFQPDVLHLHLPNTSAFWVLFSAAARRLPWVIHWHSDVVDEKLSSALALAYHAYRPFEQALLKRSHSVIVTSPPYLQASAALAPWRHKCQIIPLALAQQTPPVVTETARLQAEALWGDGGDAALRILNIGRMTYYKGHQVLIDAMQAVPHAHAILVGRGELQTHLQAEVDRQGLSSRVTLPGFVSDELLNALLATCDCFCLPSLERTEAFGVVLLEAMRHAKPVVASQLKGSGVSWVIQADQTGLLVPTGDAPALAAALRRLQADRALCQRLGEAGHQRLLSQFQIDTTAARTADIYRQCLMKKDG